MTNDPETMAVTVVENSIGKRKYDAKFKQSEDESDLTALACDAGNLVGSLYGFLSCVRVL